VPTWAKIAAAVVAVALVAVGNVAAKKRQERNAVAAQDRVAATTALTSTVSQFEVQLLLSVHNAGKLLRVSAPHLTAPGFTLLTQDTYPYLLNTGATNVFVLRLQAPCRKGQLSQPVPDGARLLLPVVPPSGRSHDVNVSFGGVPLSILGQEACGLVTADRSAAADFTDVVLEKYAVSFNLAVGNQAPEPLVLQALTGPGLNISVRGGLPIDIAPMDTLVLPARLSIPGCAGLPLELDPQRPKTSYPAIELALSWQGGRRLALPVLLDPGTPMFEALRALARNICPPGSFRSGTGRRGSRTR
jgi:hypothetical protein